MTLFLLYQAPAFGVGFWKGFAEDRDDCLVEWMILEIHDPRQGLATEWTLTTMV
jgi:hypothetical protein